MSGLMKPMSCSGNCSPRGQAPTGGVDLLARSTRAADSRRPARSRRHARRPPPPVSLLLGLVVQLLETGPVQGDAPPAHRPVSVVEEVGGDLLLPDAQLGEAFPGTVSPDEG